MKKKFPILQMRNTRNATRQETIIDKNLIQSGYQTEVKQEVTIILT